MHVMIGIVINLLCALRWLLLVLFNGCSVFVVSFTMRVVPSTPVCMEQVFSHSGLPRQLISESRRNFLVSR